MIRVESNIAEVLAGYLTKLDALQPGGILHGSTMREIATTMRGEMLRRIHSEGKNAEGNIIGKYSPAYEKRKNKAGRNQLGTVNLSWTGQLANQFSVVETSNGYGLGWFDFEKRQRADFLELRYGKVWGLTREEKDLANQIAQQKVQEIFN